MSDDPKPAGPVADAELFRLWAENVRDYAVFVIDDDRRVRTWSPACERLLGYSEPEILGERSDRFFTAEDIACGRPAEEIREALDSGRGDNDRWHVRKDGTRFWSAGALTPLRDGQGRLRGFAKVMRDQTALHEAERARREAEERLRQSEARFRGLMDQAPFSVQIFSADGRTARVNRAWEELWGVGFEQVADYNVLEDAQLEAKGVLPHLRRAFAGEPAALPEIAYDPNESIPDRTRHEEPVRWVSAVAYPVKDAGGAVREVVLVHEDVTARRRAERSVREKAEALSGILAASVDHIYVVGSDGRYRYVSAGGARALGFEPEAVTGRHWRELGLPAEVMEPFDAERDEAIRTGRPGRREVSFAGPGGAERSYEYVVFPLAHEGGRADAVVAVSRDVTDRRRAERLLDRYRLLSEYARDIVLFVRPDGRIAEANEAAAAAYGYDRETLQAMRVADLRDPATVDDVPAQLAAAAEAGIRFETIHRRRDGTPFPVEVSSRGAEVGGERLLLSVIRDIGGRKRAEAAQRASEERLRTLSDNLPNGAVYQAVQVPGDQTARFTYFSAGAEAVFGVTAEAAVAEAALLYGGIHEEDRPGLLAAEAQAIERMVAFDYEFRYRTPSGETRWVHARSAPRRLADGGVVWEGLATNITARKEAERRLVLAFRVLGSMAEGVSVSDEAGVIIYTNPAEDRIFGYGPGELVGRHVREQNAYPPEQNERIVSEVIARLKADGIWTGDFLNRRKDGSVFTTACRISALGLDGATYFICVQEDVTERRRAEEEQRRQKKLLNTITDNADSALVMVDAAGRLTFVNPAFTRITGYSPEEAVGRLVHETVHYKYPDGRPFPIEECPLDGAYRKRRRPVQGHEDVFTRKDGSLFPVVASVAPLLEEGEDVVGCVAEFRDVTRQKEAEAELVRNERLSRFLADAGAALAALADRESTLRKVAGLAVPHFADWCAVDMLEDGVLRRVAVAHSDPEKVRLAHEYDRRFPADPDAPRGVWRILRTGEPELVPEITDDLLEATVTDPERLRLLRELGLKSYIGVPLKIRDAVLGVLTFVGAESGRRFDERDLALAEDLARRAAVAIENVRLYDDLRDADRRKNEFLAMLGHELRNPLAPIRSGLDLLKITGAEADVVDLMSGQVDHLVRLVDDLLDVSRILRGRVELKRSAVELGDLLGRAVRSVRPMIEAQGQSLDLSLPAEPVRLEADPVRLTQVLTNLLNNASKYTEAGGRIAVSAERGRGEVAVRVTDTGIGIDPDLLPHVFDLFTQSTRSIDRAQGGLGIGLTVVKNLVEMHGGSVEAKSQGVGRGSEFSLRLPTFDASAASPESSPLKGRPAPARRILVVDDNVPAAKLLVRLLGKLGGHEIVTAHDGEGALAAAQAYRPHLILLDIGLPRMDGYEVARRLRSRPEFDDTLLVALTGYGTEEDRRRSAEAGFDEHVTKPPSVESLRNLLADPKLSP